MSNIFIICLSYYFVIGIVSAISITLFFEPTGKESAGEQFIGTILGWPIFLIMGSLFFISKMFDKFIDKLLQIKQKLKEHKIEKIKKKISTNLDFVTTVTLPTIDISIPEIQQIAYERLRDSFEDALETIEMDKEGREEKYFIPEWVIELTEKNNKKKENEDDVIVYSARNNNYANIFNEE